MGATRGRDGEWIVRSCEMPEVAISTSIVITTRRNFRRLAEFRARKKPARSASPLRTDAPMASRRLFRSCGAANKNCAAYMQDENPISVQRNSPRIPRARGISPIPIVGLLGVRSFRRERRVFNGITA